MTLIMPVREIAWIFVRAIPKILFSIVPAATTATDANIKPNTINEGRIIPSIR